MNKRVQGLGFRLLNEENLSLLLLPPPLPLWAEAQYVSSFILLVSTHTMCFFMLFTIMYLDYLFSSLLKQIILDYSNDSVFLIKEDRSDNFLHNQRPW